MPVVVDFRVHRDAMVWPMVAAGTSNDDIKYARDLAPEFDEDETWSSARERRRTPSTPCRVLVENKPGVLARIAGLFSRRGFNIDSLAVGPTEHPEISRMTIVVNVEDTAARAGHQAAQQAGRGDQDRRARRTASVNRELLLVKVGRHRRDPRPGARHRPALPGQGRRRRPRRGHHPGRPATPTSSPTSCACSSPSASASSCSPAWSRSVAAPARSPSAPCARSPCPLRRRAAERPACAG